MSIEKLAEKKWHALTPENIFQELGVSPEKGLSTDEVKKRQDEYGFNRLTPRKGKGPLIRFLLQFHQPLIYILLAATLITALLQEWIDSGVIFAVVLVNAVIGFIQESKALAAIDALAKTMTSEATVIRDGDKQDISAPELVPGDIVVLQSGDKVPADVCLVQVRELQVDESALTGESVPVQKIKGAVEEDTVLADRKNMAYSSALITYGSATGVVIGTGDNTEIGRISELISTAEDLATPLTKKIAHFSHILLYAIIGMAGVTFAVGIWRGQEWIDMFMAAVALAVGAIPEGLPAAVTITLAIGVGRMAKRNAIIRKLPAVETLGSTTVICSDKTGTLTQNQMTVQDIYAGGHVYSVEGIGYKPEGSIKASSEGGDPKENAALTECLKTGILCNDSRLRKGDEGWKIEGDPTEGALIVSALKGGLSEKELPKEYPREDAIPFESERQYMATLHSVKKDSSKLIFVKGAIEAILDKCRSAVDASGHVGDLNKEEIQRQADAMASKGLRVLAFARKSGAKEKNGIQHEDITGDLELLGIQGMIDPPREEAIAAVQACKAAGIQVKMITGDHAITAAAIAQKIGLNDQKGLDGNLPVLNGKEIAALPEDKLIEKALASAVFARVAPEQKLRLVSAHQSRNHVVAMTGDGVNDAPALKQANIGVAMGITGTEVSKEAADMILTDDNFASIKAAVEEGRGVFDNLVKFITWTLPTNVAEGLVILVAVFAGTLLPILPVQILWINMTTAILLGLMLAFEPKEPGIMTRPPRDPEVPILTKPLLMRIGMVGLILVAGAFTMFEYHIRQGDSEAQARTIAVNVVVFGELFYLFNCRSLIHSMFRLGIFSNRWVLGGVSAMIVLQLLYTYNPIMNTLFQSAPIGGMEWLGILGVSLVVYLVVELEKWIRRKQQGIA